MRVTSQSMAEGLDLPERPPQTRIRTTPGPGRQPEKVLCPPTGPRAYPRQRARSSRPAGTVRAGL